MKDIEFLKENGVDVDHGIEILGDLEMYDETLSDFLEEAESKLDNLELYMKTGDMDNYAILAHSMKSDSKYLGFTKLAEISYDHELKGKEHDNEYVTKNFETLKTEANRIIGIVKNYLN